MSAIAVKTLTPGSKRRLIGVLRAMDKEKRRGGPVLAGPTPNTTNNRNDIVRPKTRDRHHRLDSEGIHRRAAAVAGVDRALWLMNHPMVIAGVIAAIEKARLRGEAA
jgi:hypothetical protein